MARSGKDSYDLGHTRARGAAVFARQHGMMAGRQLQVIAGIGQPAIRARVRAGTLFEELPGVYSLSPVVSDDGRRAAALLAVDGWAALSDASAAELYRIGERIGPHHITTTTRKRSIPGKLVVHRTRAPIPTRRIRGMPVTEPGRVLIDLAVRTSGRPLERLVGETIYRRLITEAGVSRIAERYPGHPGAANLTAIDPEAARRRRTETDLDEDVLRFLDTLPVPQFVCQHRLQGLSGKPYRADFAWPDLHVILEADGRAAHERRAAMDSDRARDADLAAVGWTTLRITGRQLRRDPQGFAAALLATLARGV